MTRRGSWLDRATTEDLWLIIPLMLALAFFVWFGWTHLIAWALRYLLWMLFLKDLTITASFWVVVAGQFVIGSMGRAFRGYTSKEK